jgi:hypothetical protein
VRWVMVAGYGGGTRAGQEADCARWGARESTALPQEDRVQKGFAFVEVNVFCDGTGANGMSRCLRSRLADCRSLAVGGAPLYGEVLRTASKGISVLSKNGTVTYV